MDNKLPLRPPTPQSMFDRVAPRYDLLNSVFSLGLDQKWRKKAALELNLSPRARILDVATGTASLPLAISQIAPQNIEIVGCDCNQNMLQVAQRRIAKINPQISIKFVECPGENLCFEDNSFEKVTIAFAIDDMKNRNSCTKEMFRVLKPGGQIVLLELSLPENPILLSIYRIYLQVFAFFGRFFTNGGYSHLREEILAYRGRLAIKQLLEANGFIKHQMKSLSGGIVTIHCAYKPQ